MDEMIKLAATRILSALISRIALHAPEKMSGGMTLLENLDSARNYSTLARAIKEARVDDVLNRPGAYTIFAPDDAAFDLYPGELIRALLNDRAKLAELLKYHIVPGKVTYSDLAKMSGVLTVDWKMLPVGRQGKTITLGGTRVLDEGVEVSNGIIYRIENVIIPPGFVMPQAMKARGRGISLGRALIGALTLGGIGLYLLTRKKVRMEPVTQPELSRARHEEGPVAREMPPAEERPAAREKPGAKEKPKAEKILRHEETLKEVRAPISAYRKPPTTDIAKNLSLPLYGDANKGLNMLIDQGVFKDKSDFIGFLAKSYVQNDVDSLMSEGIELHMSRVMDIIHRSGIARNFFDTDTKKYLVPLFRAGFRAIHDYTSKKPATKLT